MKKKFNFVYITTNLLNGKQYIGDHSTNNLEDGYLGSGKLLKESFKKYNKDNFKCDILEFFDTKEEAFEAQEKYINEYNTLVPNGYNVSPKGGYGVLGSYLNEETKKKIGKAHKGKIGISFINYNKKYKKNISYKEQMIEIYGEEIGIIKAEEYKEKISKNTSGQNNGMYKQGEKLKGEKNGMYNKNHSPETCLKLSQKALKRKRVICKFCKKETTPQMYNRWHGKNCKLNNEK